MFKKKVTIIFILTLLYQSQLFSESTSLNQFDSKNLSKYFSGIVAFENKDNSQALDFFNSSKILLNRHEPYLEKLVMSLVLEDKVIQAINLLKTNEDNSKFFEAYILLALDSLKKNNIKKAKEILSLVPRKFMEDRLNFIIVSSLIQFSDVFKDKKISKEKNNFGNLSLISEAFQRCYLDDKNTDSFFSRLIENNQGDYSRYIFFLFNIFNRKK